MFEKSLYDLIRGLRHYKGNEREYIQNSLRECRIEIKGQDMNAKATALLKLVYLEMFGHDMSWAAFNVLEVMSSPKYFQKRVGYLGAVQSFRPDTEVLMLATNLLKKDITSSSVPTICAPLVTIPHIATPSLAVSLLPDLTPRLAHSVPSVRKKTLVTLYRLALVYPETLRLSWPKFKEILMDEEEDSSVTAAAINVVCELGWRRPRDFLPLAPRMFDLLVSGGNNWMAIKIIKLFATLTPLEPRLIRKLLPPLTNLIRSTPAMSLLYECIHGIIQGGILSGGDSYNEREEIAELCVSKLQGMIATDGDPNLKYVALLSFNSIVKSHPHLIASHQDLVLDCIEDPDVSIRFQALELSFGMINANNLEFIVERLVQQLRVSPTYFASSGIPSHVEHAANPETDSDGEDSSQQLKRNEFVRNSTECLPDEYRHAVISRILDMCSQNTYANVTDFEWYLEKILELAKHIPFGTNVSSSQQESDVSEYIGAELRNIAVRVVAVRAHAVRAAAQLLSTSRDDGSKWPSRGIMSHAAWVIGEYAAYLPDARGVLDSLLLSSMHNQETEILCACLHAIPKLLAAVFRFDCTTWEQGQKSMVALLLARVVHFLEPLTSNANLEVQERAVEFLELFRVAVDAVSAHDLENTSPPLLLTRVLPSLFNSSELGPVAASAQKKVPSPTGFDLSQPINDRLSSLLSKTGKKTQVNGGVDEVRKFYHEKPPVVSSSLPTVDILHPSKPSSYQDNEDFRANLIQIDQHPPERQQRTVDDSFYILRRAEDYSQLETPIGSVIGSSNTQGLDLDSIPIMALDLGSDNRPPKKIPSGRGIKKQERAQVAKEETLDSDVTLAGLVAETQAKEKSRKGLLNVDSSGIGDLPLGGSASTLPVGGTQVKSRDQDDVEMAKALAEVERVRMEMQRASERVGVENNPDEGTLVKKKKKKKGIKASSGANKEDVSLSKPKKGKPHLGKAQAEERNYIDE